jgi:O-antigen/teichoic acid export membrane protein
MINPENNTSLSSYPPTEAVVPELEKSQSGAGSLTARTFQGLKWSYLDTGINAVLQIGYTAVMARLLTPADFGLVAMANVVLRFGSYFAQMGMGSALVQKKDLSQEEIRAGFTSNVFLSVLMFTIIWLAAPLSTYIFNNEAVVPVVRWLALSFIFTGLSTTAVSLLRRSLDFRAIAIIHIISFIIGYAGFGILMALNDFGVYSLVGAALSQGAILAFLAYLFSRHNLFFIFRWKYFKNLYSFGTRVTVISFMEFLNSNLDTMAIGRFLGEIALGFYNRAFMLVNLPMYYLVTSISRVLMPSYSKLQDDLPRLKRTFLSSLLIVGSILIPVCWGLSVASRETVLLILGNNWVESIPILQVLAIAIPFYFLSHLAAILLEATARLTAKIIIQFFTISLLIVLFIFFNKFGVLGFAISIGLVKIIEFFIYIIVIMKYLNIKFNEIISRLNSIFLSGFIVSLLIYLSGFLLRRSEFLVWQIFLSEVIIAGLILLFLITRSQLYLDFRKEIREIYLKTNTNLIKYPLISKLLRKFTITN